MRLGRGCWLLLLRGWVRSYRSVYVVKINPEPKAADFLCNLRNQISLHRRSSSDTLAKSLLSTSMFGT
jgi:hypothetical protein